MSVTKIIFLQGSEINRLFMYLRKTYPLIWSQYVSEVSWGKWVGVTKSYFDLNQFKVFFDTTTLIDVIGTTLPSDTATRNTVILGTRKDINIEPIVRAAQNETKLSVIEKTDDIMLAEYDEYTYHNTGDQEPMLTADTRVWAAVMLIADLINDLHE